MSRVYISSSYRNISAIRLLTKILKEAGHCVLDWTPRAMPPSGLTPSERRTWLDTSAREETFAFCSSACASVDVVIYLGDSGQDAGVEVGMAWTAGVPVLGVAGPFEKPGPMLSEAVSAWVTMDDLLEDPVHFSSLLVTASQRGIEC